MWARNVAVCLLLMGTAAALFFLRYRSTPPPAPDPETLFPRALDAVKRGKIDRADEIRKTLADTPGYREKARLLRGIVLLRRGEHALALEFLSAVPPKDDLSEPALLYRGECLYRLGRLAEAEVLMRQLVRDDADHVDAHRWLGSIYYDMGANDLALNEFKIVVKLAPKDYRPHWMMAMMYFDFEQNAQATEHYRRALELEPPAAVRHVIVPELAKSLIADRRFREALKRLTTVKPDITTLPLIAECHWSMGNRKLADETLAKARALDPDARAVLFLQARIELGARRPMAAIAPLKRILKTKPHDARCRYQLALAYRQLERTADYEREMSQWKESKALWEKLTELNIKAIREPANADVRDELAAVCETLGKDHLAVMWRKAAATCRSLRGGGT